MQHWPRPTNYLRPPFVVSIHFRFVGFGDACGVSFRKTLVVLTSKATLPPVVVDLAGSILTSPMRISIGDVNAAAPDVEQPFGRS